eukprot:gb/GEZN01003844.1/.p1 GENE.gb/GEZN01003844.1/~~gb/GEZN01003844.1/.p1  ORF type:complete len:555 (-),score=91.59 gb/GEZN01003844.1/:391-2055(-)
MSDCAGDGVYARTDKEKKYDRQMRMWGPHGQKALESGSICMLGSGPTASETLKNLVLPCVGTFTIVDNAVVKKSDLGNNFFVTKDALGKNRAEVVRDLLVEMNDEVKDAKFVAKRPEDLIKQNLAFFDTFTVVMACNVQDAAVQVLAKYLFPKNIPLIILKAYGMLGSARLALAEHTMIETHPDGDTFDLYLHPEQLPSFPELQAYIASYPPIESISSSQEKGEVPFIVILVQGMAKWQKEHDGKMPQNYNDKFAFKDMLRSLGTEENFDEAVEHAKRVYDKFTLREEVQHVFDHPRIKKLDKSSSSFWFMSRGCLEFYNNEGKGTWPCSASIPDMTTSTKKYVDVQEIYKKRADKDAELVHQHVLKLVKSSGSPLKISLADTQHFCKNVRQVGIIVGRSLEQEYTTSTANIELITETFEDFEYREAADPEDENAKLPNPKNLHWYFALRAADLFNNKHGRFPGSVDKALADDRKELAALQSNLFKEMKLSQKIETDCLAEVVRAGPSEIHNTAATVGGVGSQIALKLLIQQYLPLNNTLIYNGLHGSASTFLL